MRKNCPAQVDADPTLRLQFTRACDRSRSMRELYRNQEDNLGDLL